MRNSIAILFLLCATLATAGARKAPMPVPSPSATPAPTYTPVTGPHPKLELTGTVGATESEKKRLQDAVTYGNQKLAYSCFKEAVLAASYDNTNGKTQAQIYDLMSKETLKLSVEIFDGNWKENYWWHTVAYEGTGAQIRLNRYFLGDSDSISQTMLHERGGHALGFGHPRGVGTGQPYGVQNALWKCPLPAITATNR